MLVDEADAAAPRSLVERVRVEKRPQRESRHDQRRSDRARGGARSGQQQPLAGEPVAALGDELLELLLRRRMAGQRVVLLELLGHDQPPGDDDQRRRDEGEGQPERQTQVLRLVCEVVERVDGDEAGRGGGRAEQQAEDEPLRARIGLSRGHDPRPIRETRTSRRCTRAIAAKSGPWPTPAG